jgi:hypothetical protein
MMTPEFRPIIILSAIIAILATVASGGGLLLDGLYRDNAFVTALWGGNDLVTLVLAVPMLIAAMTLARRGSHRALLVWLAMLNYMLYNFAFYVFAAAFNWFFLIYVALFTLSAIALIFGLARIDTREISQRFRPRTPIKLISSYLLLVGIGLSTIYVIQSLGFIIDDTLPEIVVNTGHPTSVIFAVDLSLLVPVFIIGAIWLWRRQPWGYVLASISMVKGTTYTLVLAVVAVWGANAGVARASDEIPIWSLLTVVGLVGTLFLLGNMRAASKGSAAPVGR